MKVTVAVIYHDAIAHYTVTEGEGDRLDAHLNTYMGDPASTPPSEISLEKVGRHCTGSIEDVALMEELYYATKEKLKHKP